MSAPYSNPGLNATAVTPLASVVVNGMIDRYFANWRAKQTSNVDFQSNDLGVYTIAQRDLVFRLKDNKNNIIIRPGANGINDVQLKVFSSYNSWPKRALGNGVSEPIESSVIFVGVALLPVDYLNKSSKDTVAILVGGSITIRNTGDSCIYPGQKICWIADQFDSKKRKGDGNPSAWAEGQPRDKLLFKIIPAEELIEKLGASADAKRIAYERGVGVALTGGAPGQQFDIMIGGSR